MLDQLQLDGVGPAQRLTLDLAERLNVLTGDNGLGKSFVLDVAWWVLTASWAGVTATPFRDRARPAVGDVPPRIAWARPSGARYSSTFDWREAGWKRQDVEGMTFGLVVYARADGGFSVWDPARNDWRQRGFRLALPEAFHFTAAQVWGGLQHDDWDEPLCEGLLRDWVRWQLKSKAGETGDHDPFEILTRALEALSPSADEPLTPGPLVRPPGATRDEPSLRLGYGVVPVRHASAGVRRVLSLAYLLVWAWSEHGVSFPEGPVKHITVLIDEVETHLHPQWQRRLLPALMDVVAGLGEGMEVQWLVTSHSPLVLASLEPIFESGRDQLYLFDQVDGAVTLRPLPWSRNGDAVNWLLSPVFAMEQARSVPAEHAIEAAEAYMRGEKELLPDDLSTAEAIDAALRRLLPDDDVFWPRWALSTRRYGG